MLDIRLTRLSTHARGRHSRARASALFLALALASTPGAVQGQQVLQADVTADVRADASAVVRIAYEVVLDPSSDSVPLLGLSLLGSDVSNLVAHSGAAGTGAELSVRFGRRASGALAGMVALPPEAERIAGPTFSFGLTYQVTQSQEEDPKRFDRVLPLILVDWLPIDSEAELFTADVRLPEGYALLETFPFIVGLEGDSLESGGTSHSITLPVVPIMLRLRGRLGPRPLLTFGLMIDLAVGLVILGLGAYGWIAMRAHRREPRPHSGHA